MELMEKTWTEAKSHFITDVVVRKGNPFDLIFIVDPKVTTSLPCNAIQPEELT